LVEFDDRDRDTGQYSLYVHAPETPGQSKVCHGDPQAEFFDDSPAHEPPQETLEVIAGVFAQEPPRPEMIAGVSAQRPPRTGQRSLWDWENSTTAETPAGVSAQKPTMVTIEDRSMPIGSLSQPSATAEGGDRNSSATRNSCSLTPTGTTRATKFDAQADAEAQRELNQRYAKRHPEPPPNDPAEQQAARKQEFIERLIAWAAEFVEYDTQYGIDPGQKQCQPMDPARAGQLFDHIEIDRDNDGKPPFSFIEMDWWLDELRNGKLSGNVTNPAGVLDHRIETRLRECGIRTRAKSKRRNT
jgi:hypothetical protein